MGISKRINSKMAKIQWSTKYQLTNKDGKLFCDKCHSRLGILRMIQSSIFKKKKQVYMVVCKKCKQINKRVKGQIGEQIDTDWDKHGF